MSSDYITLSNYEIGEYFARMQLPVPEALGPTSDLLHKIHVAHCMTVPYENQDILRKVPLSLKEADLYEKIVLNYGGGLCFELNGSLAMLLRSLGYGVKEYAARYLRGESTIPMRRHRVLVVQALDGCWLCDVGIGERAQRAPMAMLEGVEQTQFGECYRFRKDLFLGWVLQDYYKGEWKDFYSFTEEPQILADYEALNFYCEQHPASPFNKQEMFAMKTPDGRITLDGHIYKKFSGDQVEVRELTDDEMPWAYEQFGLKY